MNEIIAIVRKSDNLVAFVDACPYHAEKLIHESEIYENLIVGKTRRSCDACDLVFAVGGDKECEKRLLEKTDIPREL